MQDRRNSTRRKTFLGGKVVYNHRQSTMDCVLKNMADGGAKLVFSHLTLVPDEFDVQVDQMQRSFRARVVWRAKDELGITFVDNAAGSTVVPLDHAIRIRRLEADRAKLQRRVAELGGTE